MSPMNNEANQANTTASESAGVAAQRANETVTSTVARVFDSVAAQGYQPRLRYIAGVCQFNLTGAGVWRATIKDGTPTIVRDPTDTVAADCVVECSAQDFMRIVRREGNMNIFAALLQGLVKVTGDGGFATALLGSVTLDTDTTVGARPQQ